MDWTNFLGIYLLLNIIFWGVCMGLPLGRISFKAAQYGLAVVTLVALVIFALFFGALPGLLSS
jgi:hypothetical protein